MIKTLAEFLKGKKVLDQFPIPVGQIKAVPENTFALRAKGNGLSPQIYETDILICEFTDRFKNKDFVVVEGKDEIPEVFQAVRTQSGLSLRKTNMSYWQYNQENVEPEIIGVVRMIMKPRSFAF